MVDENAIREAIKKLRASPKRKFVQTVELIVNLKDIDVKKEEGKIEELLALPNGRGEPAKICALIGPELLDFTKGICDRVILADDFEKLSQREIKRIARDYTFFIAQANIMPLVAKVFGRALASKGKMPTPKFGLIVPPKSNVKPLVEKLRKSIKLISKKAPVIQTIVGNEKMSDEELMQNIIAVLDLLKAKLPNSERNIKNIILKLTMGAPISVNL
ncbi:MAG: 50S ribosomal protein L1 [Candidatus Nanoarchaeia archaeon]